jgi:hypothetical protein
MLEGLMAVAADGAPRYRPPSRSDEALRQARTCYDHLAGRLGVALADALLSRGHIVLDDDGGQVTADGTRFFGEFGLNLAGAASQRRRFCRPCLDWSERRRHLGGAVGAAVAVRCFELGWIDRVKGSHAVAITSSGHRGFFEIFGIPISDDWKLPGRRDEVIADPMYSRTASHHIARSAIGRVRLVAIVKRHLPIAAITLRLPLNIRNGVGIERRRALGERRLRNGALRGLRLCGPLTIRAIAAPARTDNRVLTADPGSGSGLDSRRRSRRVASVTRGPSRSGGAPRW